MWNSFRVRACGGGLDGLMGRRLWHGGLVSVQLRREAIKAEQGVGSGSARDTEDFLLLEQGVIRNCPLKVINCQ